VPDSVLPLMNDFLNKLGYRFVLRQLQHPSSAAAGSPISISMNWDNVGVAPSYGTYILAIQIRRSDGTTAATIATATHVKDWMPGQTEVDQTITLPASLTPGTYTLAIGLVDPSTLLPKIQLASSGKDANGWYPWSQITVQ
jgi:hypothetical protein